MFVPIESITVGDYVENYGVVDQYGIDYVAENVEVKFYSANGPGIWHDFSIGTIVNVLAFSTY